MKNNNRGQIEITFNWIYVLIAGAVILLFFVGIVIRQKNVSQERLSIDILEIMETIFTGAEVSEQTKNFVGTSSLADYTLYFACREGVSTYGLKEANFRKENSITPIFSPAEIKSPLIVLWSMPYKLPFKIMDFLLVTSSNTKYYVIGDGGGFREEFSIAVGSDVTDERLRLNIDFIDRETLSGLEPGNNFHLRLVDLDGNVVNNNGPVPDELAPLDDKRVSAVSFSSDSSTDDITFYQKNDKLWETTGSAKIISMGGERDAAKYAAIFAADAQQYKCNMQKAFQRAKLVAEIYQGKLASLQNYYERLDQQGYGVDACIGFVNSAIKGGYPERNLADTLTIYKINIAPCALGICTSLLTAAASLKDLNNDLSESCKVPLY